MYFLGVFCLVAGFAVPLTLTCSCHPDYLSETRSEVICNAYSNEVSIYKARITTAKCKCLLRQSLFSCIDFKLNSSQNVVGRVQGLYNCSIEDSRMPRLSYYYRNCPSIISKAGNASIVNNTVDIEDINCDNIQLLNEEDGCAISRQPCYYTAIVEAVYKGNVQVGHVMNTSGPDVLTTCGYYGRILTVGESYIVGIGGPCFRISSWESFSSYTTNDIRLLESLRAGGAQTCSSSSSSSSSSAVSLSRSSAGSLSTTSAGSLSTTSAVSLSTTSAGSLSTTSAGSLSTTSAGSVNSISAATPTQSASSGLNQQQSIIVGLSVFLSVVLILIIISAIVIIIIIIAKTPPARSRRENGGRDVVRVYMNDEDPGVQHEDNVTSDDKAAILNNS